MDDRGRAAWSAARPGAHPEPAPACVAPWVSLELDPTGWVYACCANQMYPLGRIGPERLADLWGGPRAQVLRDALTRWDLSVGCSSCSWHIQHGRTDTDAAVYDRYPMSGSTPSGPVAMTFALSNRCNLGCVMCTPELSSTLRHQAGLAPIDAPYDDAFFEELAPMLPGLRYAKFLGGEPFLIPEHHRVWDLMASHGGPPRIQVTTNGTIWNRRVEAVLDQFAVDVTVSIDAASAAAYESIRVGSSFDVVVANIDRFAARAREQGTELRLCFCLMDRNADELAPFLRWADRLGAAVTINIVSDVGLALHDLGADDLAAVLDNWRRQQDEGGFGVHEDTWATQVRQTEEVLAERRAGMPPPPRQAKRARPADLVVPRGGRGTLVTDVATERARLHAWSEGGPVGELRGSADGTVTEVVSGHARLGVTSALVGQPLGAVLPAVEAADGRSTWVLGVDDGGAGTTIRTFVLASDRPVRGGAGSIVRTVGVPHADGWVLLVAEDRAYDRHTVVAIPDPVRRTRG